MKKLIQLAFLITFSSLCYAQNLNYNGSCSQGSVKALTSGSPSSNYLQSAVPGCLVSVYVHSSQVLAAIFLEDGTPKPNPFTAQSNAAFNFYASSNSHYDVTMRASGMTTTTLTDVSLGSGGAGGSVTSVSGGVGGGMTVNVANPTTTPNITVAADGSHYIPNTGDVSNWNGKVNRTGDTMTGPLNIAAFPVNSTEVTNKNYVDTLNAQAQAAAAAAQATANAAQPQSQKNQVNGYAGLDATARVPRAFLPNAIAYTDTANAFSQSQSITGNLSASGDVKGGTVSGGALGNVRMMNTPIGTAISCLTLNGSCSTAGVGAVGLIYNNTVPNDLVLAYGVSGHLSIQNNGVGAVNQFIFDSVGNLTIPGVVGGGFISSGTTTGPIAISAFNCGPGNQNCRNYTGQFTTQFNGTGAAGQVGTITFAPAALSTQMCLVNGVTSTPNIAALDIAVSGTTNTVYTFNLVNGAANTAGAILTVKYICSF